jgi:hypothetical protein
LTLLLPLQGGSPRDCKNHLHQLHVCLPSRAGHTRLLYRMATDFLWWTEYVPGIQQFWKYIAGQVGMLSCCSTADRWKHAVLGLARILLSAGTGPTPGSCL